MEEEAEAGVFVTLYDRETLEIYLKNGVYGTLMPPVDGMTLSRTRHFHTLGDYSCLRGGMHLFFFLKRFIVYGGRIKGSKKYGAFYLNGMQSPLGKAAEAPLVWDESNRSRYTPTSEEGLFEVPDAGRRCQPYLVLFDDDSGLRGRKIRSDELYFKLGRFPYPLPSNSIQGMSFCVLTPGETDILLDLMNMSDEVVDYAKSQEMRLEDTPTPFHPKWGIGSVKEAYEAYELLKQRHRGRETEALLRGDVLINEAHLEASVLANPELLPREMQPRNHTLSRQVPISPFKPFQMDRADICYYSREAPIGNGTLPSVIIELKMKQAGKAEVEQVERYLDWLFLVRPEEARQVRAFLYAPMFSRRAEVTKHRGQVNLITF